jgi:hypothetical protein
MAKEITQEKLDKMVNIVLRAKGTPREHLFEYPYRADESQQLIKNAENTVRSIIAVMNAE